jgi:hypothetical protein
MTTSMTTARTALGALLALALLPALWPGDAAAHTCDAPFSTNLIAGQTIDAGDVKVCNDDTNLTVTYEATFPWCLLATDLHVATSKSGIPQTNQGNPKPDEFAYGDEHDCAGTAAFEIPLDEIDGGVEPGDTVFIAAHAEVEDGAREEGAWGKGTRFVERGDWAMYFTYVVQAPTSCVCDARTAQGGTTGAEILASLCPGGVLGPAVSFINRADSTQVFSSSLLYSVVTTIDEVDFCALRDTAGGVMVPYVITSSEAEACREHLRVSCGQTVP